MSDHYVDNKKFFAEMVKWKDLVKQAEDVGDPKPQVTEYIGECFLLIAERLSTRPNFINYPYRDEMIGIRWVFDVTGNFDPEKSKNPFAYFTQCCCLSSTYQKEIKIRSNIS